MKFDKTLAEKELASLVSKHEIFINEKEFPQLHKMYKKGNSANWKEYISNKDKE